MNAELCSEAKRPYRHFPDGVEILQVVFKRYKATFQGGTGCIFQKSLFSNHPNAQVSVLSRDLFPKLASHFEELIADQPTFKGIKLEEGWIIGKETVNGQTPGDGESSRPKKRRIVMEWVARDAADCLAELAGLCDLLVEKIERRYRTTTTAVAILLLKCLDITDILTLMEGRGLSAGQRAALLQHGSEEFARFFAYVMSLPHVQRLQEANTDLDLHTGLSGIILRRFKDIIIRVGWQNFDDCRNAWFPSANKEKDMPTSVTLNGFRVVAREGVLEDEYEFRFGCKTYRTVFDHAKAFKTFYTKDGVYKAAGRELCIKIRCGARHEWNRGGGGVVLLGDEGPKRGWRPEVRHPGHAYQCRLAPSSAYLVSPHPCRTWQRCIFMGTGKLE